MGLALKGYGHQKSTEEEHEDKVSGASPERALLQHTTVPVPGIQWLRPSGSSSCETAKENTG